MKNLSTFLFCYLILAAGSVLASENPATPDKKQSAVTTNSSESVETIWVEKRLTPATQWIENLVAPLTSWAEQKIQLRDESKAEGSNSSPRANITQFVHPGSDTDAIINSEQAVLIAKSAVRGEVLRVKLLEKEVMQYRVKLISELGEIHLLYIHAHSGKLADLAHSEKES